jgi:hypothetical protein
MFKKRTVVFKHMVGLCQVLRQKLLVNRPNTPAVYPFPFLSIVDR